MSGWAKALAKAGTRRDAPREPLATSDVSSPAIVARKRPAAAPVSTLQLSAPVVKKSALVLKGSVSVVKAVVL